VTGYVYDVDVRVSAGKTRTTYTVSYACDPKNVSKARELIQRDLISMQKENVPPAELQQAMGSQEAFSPVLRSACLSMNLCALPNNIFR
jgi:hypothetical protein